MSVSDEKTPAGYNRAPNGEPSNPDDWNAGYEEGIRDAGLQTVAWLYVHDGSHDEPILSTTRWLDCAEPWSETALSEFDLAVHALEKVYLDAVSTGSGEHSISEEARKRVEFAVNALGLQPPADARKRVVMCEGAATGQALHEATGLPVVTHERIPVEGPVNPGEMQLRYRLRKPGESVKNYRIAMGWDKQPSGASAVTAQEFEVLKMTAELYNALMALPDKHPSDADDSARDIHAIQNRVMARLAVRAHPDFFHQPRPSPETSTT